MPTPEEYEAAGLYDPASEHAALQLELLHYLASVGISLEEMVAADDLRLLAFRHFLRRGHGPRHTVAEVAELVGEDPAIVVELWQYAGFPDPGASAVFDDEDVGLIRTFQLGRSLLGEVAVAELTRVLGTAAAQVADAMQSTYLVNVAGPTYHEDPVGLQLARANAESTQLLPLVGQIVDILVRRHMELSNRPIDDLIRAASGHDSKHLAVVFVDLVGSTALTVDLSPADLSFMLRSFELRASAVIAEGGGRLVKLIGDEVMFVSTDDAGAVEIALDLIDVFRDDPVLPPVRAGIAFGPALAREGDYFGPVVNLAARVTRLAAPSTLLAAGPVPAGVAAAGMVEEDLGSVEVKGFPVAVPVVRLSR